MLFKLIIAAAGAALLNITAAQAPGDVAALETRLAEIVETECVVGASVAITDTRGELDARGFG